MNGAILITSYRDNCADCPCCDFTEFGIYCLASKDPEEPCYQCRDICTKQEYYSHRTYDMDKQEFVGEYKAPRPTWCPLIEVGGTDHE